MPRWKLSNQDPSSLLWTRSTTDQEIIIEAESEILARLKAAQKFGIAVRKSLPGEDQPTSPWLDPIVVSCRRV